MAGLSATDYLRQLQALLPQGFAWPRAGEVAEAVGAGGVGVLRAEDSG